MLNFHLRNVLRDPDPGNGGGGDPIAFDPAAFKVELLGEFNRALNGALKGLKTDIPKWVTSAFPKPPDPDPNAPPPDPDLEVKPKPGDAPPVDPALNARLQKAERAAKESDERIKRIEAERDAEKAANLETQRKSAITEAMASIPFRDEASRQLFYKGIQGDIVRDEDGNLIGNSENGPLPLKDFIKAQADSLQNLLAPKGGGGSGARPGSSSGGGRNYSNDDLKPENWAKLKPEEQSQVRAGLAEAMARAQRGE
jgi:hypothetical protein